MDIKANARPTNTRKRHEELRSACRGIVWRRDWCECGIPTTSELLLSTSAASDGSAEEEFLLGTLKDDNTKPPAPCGMLIHKKLLYDASHILLRFFFLFAGNSLAPQTFVAFESG
jgi:hypothetical protein